MRIAQIVMSIVTVALIIKFGFGAAVLLLLVIAAIYVLAAIAMPIIIRATTRVEEKPAVRALELDDASIPETARASRSAELSRWFSLEARWLSCPYIHRACRQRAFRMRCLLRC